MHLINTKNKANDLRQRGYSYSYISNKLKISKSTLNLWLRDVSFIPNNITKQTIKDVQKIITNIRRVDKIKTYILAEKFAEKMTTKMSLREIFFAGIGIYIGEGSKTANFTRIVNSDPAVIKFMIFWLRRYFSVTSSNLKIRLHIYPDTNQREAVKYWKKLLKLPLSCFHTCYIDNRNNKKIKKMRVLKYGTAHLTVVNNGNKTLGVLLHRKILATIGSVLKAGLV